MTELCCMVNPFIICRTCRVRVCKAHDKIILDTTNPDGSYVQEFQKRTDCKCSGLTLSYYGNDL